MFCCNIYPRQTWLPLALGTIIEPLGITMLAVALSGGHLPTIYGMLALTGVGTGIRFMPGTFLGHRHHTLFPVGFNEDRTGTLHGVGYFRTQIASIVSLMSLSVSLGGTFATTIMLNIFNNNMRKSGLTFSSSSPSSFDAISSLSPTEQAYVREKSKSSITLSFFAISAFMWLGTLAVSGLGNVDIAKNGMGDEEGGEEGLGGKVVKGSYIGSLLQRHRGGIGKDTS